MPNVHEKLKGLLNHSSLCLCGKIRAHLYIDKAQSYKNNFETGFDYNKAL